MALYCLAGIGGCAFGWLQCAITQRTVFRMQGRRFFLALSCKLLLWAAAMVLLALWSVIGLVVFALCAAATMIALAILWWRREGKNSPNR